MQRTLNEIIDNPLNQKQIDILKTICNKEENKHSFCTFIMLLGAILICTIGSTVTVNSSEAIPFFITIIFISTTAGLIIHKLFKFNNNILKIDRKHFQNTFDFNTINVNIENIPATNKRIHKFIKNIQSQNRDFLSFEKTIIEGMLKI